MTRSADASTSGSAHGAFSGGMALSTSSMPLVAERHHWLNTIVGMLDSAFHLTDEEQFFTFDIIRRLLDSLNIPDRSTPKHIPTGVALEVTSSYYTMQLSGPRALAQQRSIRHSTPADIVVSLEAWRQAFVNMLTSSYPDLSALQKVVLMKVFTDLLAGLGVPDRAAFFFPEDVVRAYRELPEEIH